MREPPGTLEGVCWQWDEKGNVGAEVEHGGEKASRKEDEMVPEEEKEVWETSHQNPGGTTGLSEHK